MQSGHGESIEATIFSHFHGRPKHNSQCGLSDDLLEK